MFCQPTGFTSVEGVTGEMAIVKNRAKVVIPFVLFKFFFSKLQILAGKEFPALHAGFRISFKISVKAKRLNCEKVKTFQLCLHSF